MTNYIVHLEIYFKKDSDTCSFLVYDGKGIFFCRIDISVVGRGKIVIHFEFVLI